MTRQPSVFVFSREYPPVTVGGTSTVARNLAVGLTAEGWQVVVVTSNPVARHDVRENIAGVTVHRVGTGVVYNHDSGLVDDSMLTHRRLHGAAARLADEFGSPDLVALPDLFCYPEAALFARSKGAPLVNILLQDFRTLTRHDMDKHRVTNGVSAERAHLLEIEEKSLRGSDHVVFISQALSNAITSGYPDLRTPHRVIYLGIDVDEITSVGADVPARERLRSTLPAQARDRPLLVGCGRLVPVKGFGPLLQALAEVDGPHLVLIGVGPQEGRLRRLAAELGVDGRVTFAGDIPRRDALTWMSLATVGVVPSVWESFCYVCAEMMALGAPVVVGAVDSLNELVPDEEYGFRVPVGEMDGRRVIDFAQLAVAIRAALADPADAARRAAASRDRILGGFTNDRFGAAMAALGAELVGTAAHG